MRHSAVGRDVPGNERWPTECLGCGEPNLAYQYEADEGDCYECQTCLTVHLVYDRRDEDGWCRVMRVVQAKPIRR